MATSIEITRFDFHVVRFMESETVQKMTDAEVGQYILLLCKAWLGNKNASLPNDPKLLAIYARTEQVSDLVMSKWAVGTDGRLYNERLSEEWAAVMGRSAKAREFANKRWHGFSNALALPQQSDGIPSAIPEQRVAIARTEPIRTEIDPRPKAEADPVPGEEVGVPSEPIADNGSGRKAVLLKAAQYLYEKLEETEVSKHDLKETMKGLEPFVNGTDWSRLKFDLDYAFADTKFWSNSEKPFLLRDAVSVIKQLPAIRKTTRALNRNKKSKPTQTTPGLHTDKYGTEIKL
jgi:uncharacterized protein YdaU (DUF1376 family)